MSVNEHFKTVMYLTSSLSVQKYVFNFHRWISEIQFQFIQLFQFILHLLRQFVIKKKNDVDQNINRKLDKYKNIHINNICKDLKQD